MILGLETPRIFTPPRRELTPETTHGFACIAFAEEILEVQLFPWQKWVLLHALELNDDDTYRFRFIVVLVGRQCGKTLVMLILALWHIYALDSRMVIGTAQDLINAEKAWGEAVEWAQGTEELEALISKVSLGHPKFLRLETGCEYRVAAASRRGGRGFSGDLILLDELREHQNWESWAAVTNTMNARPKAQAWAFSNAGDHTSIVLRHLRATAHRALGWPDGDNDKLILGDEEEESTDDLGFFEYSAPLGLSRSDRTGWAQSMPSMNHTDIAENCITERAIASILSTSPASVFEVECLCRWPSVSDGGPFPSESWAETADTASKVSTGTASTVCLEIPADRSRAYLARATFDAAGKPVVGIWKDQAGTDWVLPFLQRNRRRYNTIVIRIGGGVPAASLANEVETAGLPWTKWNSVEVAAGCGQMFDLLRDRTMRHLPHPALDTAATSAATRVQTDGGWVVDAAKSPTDTAPLVAAIGAVWGLGHLPDDRPSIYSGAEGADVLVL
jgi:hypothetical protein